MTRILYVADASSVHTQRWLKHYRDLGFEVHVASFVPADVDGVGVHILPKGALGKIGYLAAVPNLRKLTKRLRPALVHAHYISSYGLVAAMARCRPLIVTGWGSDLLVNAAGSRFHAALTRLVLRNSVAATVVAEHMMPLLRALAPGALPTYCIPFGVDTDLFVPRVSTRDDRCLRIVCTRNLEPIYDHITLISGFKVLLESGVVATLDLIGSGSLRDTLKDAVRAIGIKDSVRFCGRLSHEQLSTSLSQYDVFVSASRSDGNNVSLNEAMASGVFPIASDIPANSQWIQDGLDGFLFPVGDCEALAQCLLRCARDKPMRDAATRSNRARIERTASWKLFSKMMDDVYNGLLAPNG